jgi:hypothetical protein
MLSEKILRRLGYPMVKVELDETQILDNIDYTRQKYLRWAVGNATIEKYVTLMLRGEQTLYDLPANVTDVLSYSSISMGSIHTLFTVENYLFQNGMYDQLLMRGGGDGYSVVSFHIAKEFLETIHRYVVDSYNFIYHKYTNQLEINPPPPSSGVTTIISGGVYQENTPGYILLRTYQIEGTDEDLYSNYWFLDYATAMCKISLGRIRSKFGSFSAVGSNTGLQMDGEALLQEGQADIERLEETLKNEEIFEGWPILIG